MICRRSFRRDVGLLESLIYLDLFGGVPLRTDVHFNVMDWAGEEREIHHHGMTVFGPMLYSKGCTGTILCADDVYRFWRCSYGVDELRMTATHRTIPNLQLEFDSAADGDKVLSCEVPEGIWEQICALAHDVSPVEIKSEGQDDEHAVEIRQALSRDDFRRVMEGVRFHECSMHAGQASLSNTLQYNLLKNTPISSRDIYNILLASPGPCNRCLCGKSKHRSTNPRKRRQEDVRDKRDAMPDFSEPRTGEILGLDLMFEDGQVYLIVVGRHMGYIHLVPVTSKKKGGVCAAIKEVILDYRRNRIQVESLYAERFPWGTAGATISESLTLSEVQSDNEGAFVAAAVELLPSYNIRSTFVSAGEHVGYVERAILTIRTRAHATMVGLKWLMPPKVKVHCLLNVAMWMNILAGSRTSDSAWVLLTAQTLNYRDLTNTVFGDLVVAHRTSVSLPPGQAAGELGISCGPVATAAGAIYFYSLSTREVKVRRRFKVATPVDLEQYDFKPNPHWVAMGDVGKSYLDFTRNRPRPNMPGEDDVAPEGEREPPAGSFMTVGASEGDLLEPEMTEIHEVETAPVQSPPARTPPASYDRNDYVRDQVAGRLETLDLDENRVAAHLQFDDDAMDVAARSEELMQKRIADRVNGRKKEVAAKKGKARGAMNLDSQSTQPRPDYKAPDWLSQSSSPPEPGNQPPPTTPVAGVPDPASTHVPDVNIGAERESVRKQPARQLPRRGARDRRWQGSCRSAMLKRRKSMRVLCKALLATEGQAVQPDGVPQESFKTINWEKASKLMDKAVDAAIDIEVKQIADLYSVCHPVHDTPAEYHRSVDLLDRKADGTWKARLCVSLTAHGGTIDYGIDLYSPTIDIKVVLLVLSIGLQAGSELTIWDVKAAYLKSPLPTKGVYVLLKPHVAAKMVECKPEWKSFLRPNGSLMVECDKAWYGLASAAALWNAEVHKTLTDACGYTQHSMVSCLYYRRVGKTMCILMLHVDDIGALFPPKSAERARVKAILEEKYEALKEQTGRNLTYIGMEIVQSDDSFSVSMARRIGQLEGDFGGFPVGKVPPINPARTQSFCTPDADDCKKFADIKRYRSLVMTLAYIANVRPDIRFHVMFLATRQVTPTVNDWARALHIASYLKATQHDSMIVRAIGKDVVVSTYTDAAYDVHLDSKSHSGVTVFVGEAGCAIYSSSNKQHCVTRSSTDAEIVACEVGALLGSYYRDVLQELGIIADVLQFQDNQSCITLCGKGTRCYDRKERHMVRRINYLKEYLDDPAHRTSLLWCPTAEMTADILTKDLHGYAFALHKASLMGWPRPIDPTKTGEM